MSAILELNEVGCERIDDLLKQCSTFQRSRDAGGRLRMVHHLGAIESALSQPEYIDPFYSALAGQEIKVPQAYFRNYLMGLCHDILTDDNLEIALVRAETFNRSAWPNLLIISSAFLTAWGNSHSQNRLLTQEATLVHAFEQYFMQHWQQIPHISRDRQVVVKLLSELTQSRSPE